MYQALLEAKNVTYSYNLKKGVNVIKNVSIEFQRGKMYALLGASGSGKSTFLSLLAGLDVPQAGEICYDGQPLHKNDLNRYRREDVALVFQSFNLIDYLTPVENVMLGGGKDAAALLESVQIPKADQKRSILQLSGGQQQRVAIARALAGKAHVLLADEPTGNLDEATAQEIIELLKCSAHQDNKCVIVVTHSKDLAHQADVIVEMYHGQIEKQRNEQ